MVQVPVERYDAGEEAWQHLVGDAGLNQRPLPCGQRSPEHLGCIAPNL